MIPEGDIGPRVFYSEASAWAWRDERGGRVFLPFPGQTYGKPECYWFPMSMAMSDIFRHRLTFGLHGLILTSPMQAEEISTPGGRYHVDGHEAENRDSDLLPEGQFPPFRVFDQVRQDYTSTGYLDRSKAEDMALRLNRAHREKVEALRGIP